MKIFEKTISSNRDASRNLICDALKFFSRIKKQGYAKDVSDFNVRLVLDEAVENAVCHGNGMNPTKTVFVRIIGYKTKIKVLIQDQGKGFNEEQVPDSTHGKNRYAPNGRGLLLLSTIGTVKWNSEGNCIMIEVYG